jgi:hypothetical protein
MGLRGTARGTGGVSGCVRGPSISDGCGPLIENFVSVVYQSFHHPVCLTRMAMPSLHPSTHPPVTPGPGALESALVTVNPWVRRRSTSKVGV